MMMSFQSLTFALFFSSVSFASALDDKMTRRLRKMEATTHLKRRQALLRVQNIHEEKPQGKKKEAVLDAEDELLWNRFLQGGNGGSMMPQPTLPAQTPAPAPTITAPAPTMNANTPGPTEAVVPATPAPTNPPVTPATPSPTNPPVTPATPSPTAAPSASLAPAPTSSPGTTTYCGCDSCTEQVWNTNAAGFTCGERISFVEGTGSSTEDACRLVGGTEFPDICGPCDPDTCNLSPTTPTTAAPTTAAPTTPTTAAPTTAAPSATQPPFPTITPTTSPVDAPVPPTMAPVSSVRCGCTTCDEDALNQMAGEFTCLARINFLLSTGENELDACRLVAGSEFPDECEPCDPDRCPTTPTAIVPLAPTPPPMDTPSLEPRTSLYCFPPFDDRERFESVWGDYILETKESGALGVCGPSDNAFTRNTVAVNGDELTLQFKKNGELWEASEVRVILPEGQMPYSYGTYSWNVKSVEWKNVNTGVVRQNYLPPSLVLGMFTWDALADFANRENEAWMHEVDVEVTRLSNPNTDNDVQFLVQPPTNPNLYRFSTRDASGEFQQAQRYEFTWAPNQIEWDTSVPGESNSHTYSTAMALELGLEDFIKCLPNPAMEVRINLWSFEGASATPMEMSDDEMVEVVIDNFGYTPSGETGVADGGICSQDCQCLETSGCSASNVCVPM